MAVSCYDDAALWDTVNDHEDRIVKLETLCKEMNTNISSLQAIVNASQSGDYITDVSPVMEGGEEVGYTITFAKKGKITIYHGKKGADGKDGQDGAPGKDGADGKDGVDTGATPKLGIRLDSDGAYYWTLNGEWLLDDNGNKIKAVGTDGKDGVDGTDGTDGTNGTDGKDGVDGVTPQLKIEDDYWFISYDNGTTWTRLTKAVGEDGKDGGDSIFADVYEKDGYVYFVLAGGESYKVPTSASSALSIEFDVEQGVAIVPGTTLKVKYTITGAEGNTLVRVSSMADYEMAPLVKPLDAKSGYIYILMYENWFDGPDDPDRDEPVFEEGMEDVTEEEYWHGMMSVLVIVTDSGNNQVIKALNFVEGVLESVDDAYLADAAAGSVTAKIKTNVSEGSYEVVIQEKAKSWLTYAPTKAEMREDALTFNVTANVNEKFRSAAVQLVNDLGQVFETFAVVQRSSIAGEVMTFADPRVETLLVGRYDMNLDGKLTYEEVATVTDIEDLFLLEKNITSFDEFEYFSSVTRIPEEFFANCKKLESVKLPESVTVIGDNAFENCVSLKSIVVPEGVTNGPVQNGDYYYSYGWFRGCTSLESVTLPSTLTALPSSCFAGCVSLKSITIPEGIDVIPGSCFSGCTLLSKLDYKTPIAAIGESAFRGCRSLKSFDLSAIVQDYGEGSYNGLGESAFACSGLTSVVIPETVTNIPLRCFAGCEDLASVTLHDDITLIGYYAFGSEEEYDYETGEEIYFSCSSLKTLELPANLERIEGHAFRGSALEGQTIEGTDIKAIVIPAKVKYIEYDAFNNCSALSAVKMLPMYPPQLGSDAFDRNTIVYVHQDALEAYKTSDYGWSYYTILPYEMMSVSLGLDFEVKAEATYDGEYFSIPVSVNVTGDEAKLDNVLEYGYFMYPGDEYYYEDYVSYHPVEALNVADSLMLSMEPYDFNRDYSAFTAKAEYQVGAYVRLVDGTVVTYDKKSVEFVYDTKPSMEILDVYVTGSEMDEWDYNKRVSYEAKVDVKGSYWMEDFYLNREGTGSVDVLDWTVIEDGIVRIPLVWSYGKEESAPSVTFNFTYITRYNYEYYQSNSVTLTAEEEESFVNAYNAWIGTWTVTGANGVVNVINIAENVTNSSYYMTGWQSYDLPVVVEYSAENDELLIYGQDLGRYEFSDGDFGQIYLRGIKDSGFWNDDVLVARVSKDESGNVSMNPAEHEYSDGSPYIFDAMEYIVVFESAPESFYGMTGPDSIPSFPAGMTPVAAEQARAKSRSYSMSSTKTLTLDKLSRMYPVK